MILLLYKKLSIVKRGCLIEIAKDERVKVEMVTSDFMIVCVIR